MAVLGLCCCVGFSLDVVRGGYSLVAAWTSHWGAFFCCMGCFWSMGSRCMGFSSCSEACETFWDQGLNSYPLHWKVDSLPLSHQESPSPQDNWVFILLFLLFFILVNLEVVQLVTFFAVSNSMQPITWIILLQIFFWWDISNTFGKRHHRSCSNFAYSSFDCHCPFPKIPSFSFHFVSWSNCSKLAASMSPSSQDGYSQEETSGPASFFLAHLHHKLFHRHHGGRRGRKAVHVTLSLRLISVISCCSRSGNWGSERCEDSLWVAQPVNYGAMAQIQWYGFQFRAWSGLPISFLQLWGLLKGPGPRSHQRTN